VHRQVGALRKVLSQLEKQERAFEEMRQIKKPPQKHGLKQRILVDHIAALSDHIIGVPGIDTYIYPPAYDAWGNTEECGFNLALGEFIAG
jgi:hypothetical protein